MNTFYTKPGDGPIPEKYSVTLVSFLRMLVDKNGKGDAHWISAVNTCSPCHYDGYDIIVHTNTAEEDSEELLKYMGVENVRMQKRYKQQLSVNTTDNNDADAYLKGQQKYWRENVPKEVTLALYNGPYFWDFELFGFTYDDYLGEI